MLIILSPAKTIDINIKNVENNSKLVFEEETKDLVSILKNFSIDELFNLMKISDKLAILNYDRYRNFYNRDTKEYTAILAFKGEAYRGLNAGDFSKEDFKYAEDTLRILSGLYGVIKPLDKIKEYRLEMGTKLENNKGKDLYEFWKGKLTNCIIDDIQSSPGEKVLINLASKEYSSVLDMKAIAQRYKIINIKFLEFKDGNHKTISVYAKKARGLMARYIIENKLSTVEGLKSFNLEGYSYEDFLSSENELIFTR